MGRRLPVATPQLGQRRRTQTAKLGCGRTPRVSYDPLGEKSGSLGTPCCRTGFCVRRNKEPICDSQIRWMQTSVLPIRSVDCCCSPKDRKLTVRIHARPCIRTQKRPNLPQGVSSSVSNVDFFRLTLAAPAYSMCTAIHSERKSQAFMKFDLRFDNTSNSQKVCSAANLYRNLESIHNLQYAVHYQIPRRFSLIKRA